MAQVTAQQAAAALEDRRVWHATRCAHECHESGADSCAACQHMHTASAGPVLEWKTPGDPDCPFCRGEGGCIECDPETDWK